MSSSAAAAWRASTAATTSRSVAASPSRSSVATSRTTTRSARASASRRRPPRGWRIPTIVRVFDAGEDTVTDASGTHPAPYIVMELVHGALLKDIIAAGPVPVADAVRYVDGILEALEYSHRAGVVHRDIKPGNVMVTDSGQVKVMDFGIARAVSDSSSTVAETTAIIGTAAYFSPEQAKGESVDARADLYSTGRRALRAADGSHARSAATRPWRSPTSTSARRRSRRPRSSRPSRARSTPSCCAPWRRIRSSATRTPRRSARRWMPPSTARPPPSASSAPSPASCTARTPARPPRPPGRSASSPPTRR